MIVRTQNAVMEITEVMKKTFPLYYINLAVSW